MLFNQARQTLARTDLLLINSSILKDTSISVTPTLLQEQSLCLLKHVASVQPTVFLSDPLFCDLGKIYTLWCTADWQRRASLPPGSAAQISTAAWQTTIHTPAVNTSLNMILSPWARDDGLDQQPPELNGWQRSRGDRGCDTSSLWMLQRMLGRGKGQLFSTLNSKISNELN